MNEKQRVALLGGAAFLLIAFLAIKTFKGSGSGDDDSTPTARKIKPDVSAVFTGTISHDRPALERRYKQIVDVDPFRVRSFRTRTNRGGGYEPDPEPREPREPRGGGGDPEPPPYVGGIWLRLTGIIYVGTSSEAVLEDRPNGRGLFASPGEHFGDELVAEVRSSSIIVQVAETAPVHSGGVASVQTTSKTLEPGDRFAFKITDVEKHLKTFAFISSSATMAASSKGLVQLDEKTAKTILERLRERARRSRGEPATAPVESATQAAPPAPHEGSATEPGSPAPPAEKATQPGSPTPPPAEKATRPASPGSSAAPITPKNNVAQPASPAAGGNK